MGAGTELSRRDPAGAAGIDAGHRRGDAADRSGRSSAPERTGILGAAVGAGHLRRGAAAAPPQDDTLRRAGSYIDACRGAAGGHAAQWAAAGAAALRLAGRRHDPDCIPHQPAGRRLCRRVQLPAPVDGILPTLRTGFHPDDDDAAAGSQCDRSRGSAMVAGRAVSAAVRSHRQREYSGLYRDVGAFRRR